jgi:TonB family protein
VTELLTGSPQSIIVAVLLAVAIDMTRRVLRLVAGGARRFWFGPDTDAQKSSIGVELLSYLLFPVLAFIAFIPSLVVITATATLMGFDPTVKLSMLAHGMALLWALTFLFLSLQIWHLMGLPGIWQRLRYLLLLIALPLLVQILTLLFLDVLFRFHFANADDLKIASDLGHLFSMGVFPFLVPVFHARVLIPVFTFVTKSMARRWRTAVTVVASAALVAALVGIFLWFAQASRTTLFAQSEPGPSTATAPAAIGVPHTCLNYYPPLSLRLHETGTAVIAFRITVGGTVRDIAIVQSTGSPRLDLASVMCATHWTYRPAMVNGQKVEAPWRAQIVWKMGEP